MTTAVLDARSQVYTLYPHDLTAGEALLLMRRQDLMQLIPGLTDHLDPFGKCFGTVTRSVPDAFYLTQTYTAKEASGHPVIDHTYLELIPFAILQRESDGSYFIYKRRKTICGKAMVELPDVFSVGLAGHLRSSVDSDHTLKDRLLSAFRELLAEETDIVFDEERVARMSKQPLDARLVYDDHYVCEQSKLGILSIFTITEDEIENSRLMTCMNGGWLSINEITKKLKEDYWKLDVWTKLSLQMLTRGL